MRRLRLKNKMVFYIKCIAAGICGISADAVEEMESGDWDLSLFTCTLGGSYRVTVRCERTEDERIGF